MATGVEGDGGRPYRMKDLCQLTGLSRQAVHFYIQQGLVPGGHKTGRNMAWYGPEHVERLQLIRKLQQERLLPLKAIKALLEDLPGTAAPEQRELLLELKSRLTGRLGPRSDETVEAAPLLVELGIEPEELDRMAELGLVGLAGGPGGQRVRSDDTWVLELWSQLREAGFTNELGFTVDDLVVYEEMVSSLFRRERRLVLERLSGLPVERVAQMMERALPLINTFFAHYHTAQVRNFFAAME